MSEPPEYLAEHVHDALARDGRLNELGICVTISGDKVFLTGDVASDERRDIAGTIALEVLPDHDVHNHITVIDRSASGGAEVVT